MKKLCKPVLCLICFSLSILNHFANAQSPSYYWDGDVKRSIETEPSLVLVEIPSNSPELQNLLSDKDVVATSAKGENTSQIIFKSESQSRAIASKIKGARTITGMHPTGQKSVSFITDEISIKFRNESDVTNISKKYNLVLVEKTAYGAYLFRTTEVDRTLVISNLIKESENVIWSCPNFLNIIQRHTTDPLYNNQYYLNNTGQNGGTNNIDINAPEAWAITVGCPIRVAVIDDGVDNHEDMNGRVLAGFTAGGTTAGAPRNDCTKGHGVACAGIIAASHNTIGIAGIAPRSQIIPVNIFPNAPTFNGGVIVNVGAATNAQVATAINWAWRPDLGNAQVISNSWGGGAPNPDMTNEITLARTSGRGNLGAIVVFASGNGSGAVSYPASIDGVITVGAINRNGNIQPYSNTGPEMDLVAPSGGLGVQAGACIDPQGDVVTTDRMGANGYETGNYTNDFGGTSAACPQVAGVAALMLSVNPNLTEGQVRNILQQNATDMGPGGFDNTFGYGRLNAFAAVNSALPYSIGGSFHICPSGTFSVSGLPSGSTIAWSSSNTSAVTINSSGVATRVGAFHGDVVIRATITIPGGCGTITLSKNVSVGRPAITNVFTDRNGCTYNVDYISAQIVGGVGAANWAITSANASNATLNNYGNGSASFSAFVADCYNLTLTSSNSCGTSSYGLNLCAVNCMTATYKVFPNPATKAVYIEFDHVDNADALPEQIMLFSEKATDAVKTVLVRDIQKNNGFQDGNKIVIDVQSLPRGTYYVHIIQPKGGVNKSEKIRIILE